MTYRLFFFVSANINLIFFLLSRKNDINAENEDTYKKYNHIRNY